MSDFKEFENPWSADNSEWFNEEKDKWFDGGEYTEWLKEVPEDDLNTNNTIINDVKINGHLFETDGTYIGKWGNTENCYVIIKNAWKKIKDETGKTQLIYETKNVLQIIDLDGKSIELNTILKLASIFYDEAGATTEFYPATVLAIACANKNFLMKRNTYYPTVTYKNLANKQKISNFAYGKNDWIKKINNENVKHFFSVFTVIHILTKSEDVTNGAVKWDGADLAWKGFNHDKPKNDGIEFLENDFIAFKTFYTTEKIKLYTGVESGFNETFSSGKHLATDRNKNRILHLSCGFIGNTIFWKPNYFAEENNEKFEIIDNKKTKTREKFNFKYYFYS